MHELHTVPANSTTCLFCKESVVYSKSLRLWQLTSDSGSVRCYFTEEAN